MRLLTLIFSILAIEIPMSVTAQFRDAKWGWPKGVVRQSEKGVHPLEQVKTGYGDVLIYKGKLGLYDVSYLYGFRNDSLFIGEYILEEHYINENNYISAYDDIKERLYTKYGNPILDDIVWKHTLYQDIKKNWGMAVSLGHLYYHALWELEHRTNIEIKLQGQNGICQLIISYTDGKNTLSNKQPYEGL